ncbi:unnamed protein product [Trichogramma brassicae]|uniref:Secreted protein n=1 Tax=Trichogramma brassicae TaxID=86971 RepID=A0A6H5J4X7_9HYME|nr:unnamed protein product [Trichogramma brassicae]
MILFGLHSLTAHTLLAVVCTRACDDPHSEFATGNRARAARAVTWYSARERPQWYRLQSSQLIHTFTQNSESDASLTRRLRASTIAYSATSQKITVRAGSDRITISRSPRRGLTKLAIDGAQHSHDEVRSENHTHKRAPDAGAKAQMERMSAGSENHTHKM